MGSVVSYVDPRDLVRELAALLGRIFLGSFMTFRKFGLSFLYKDLPRLGAG